MFVFVFILGASIHSVPKKMSHFAWSKPYKVGHFLGHCVQCTYNTLNSIYVVYYNVLHLDGCIFSEMHISSCDLFHIQNTCHKTSRLHSRPREEKKIGPHM